MENQTYKLRVRIGFFSLMEIEKYKKKIYVDLVVPMGYVPVLNTKFLLTKYYQYQLLTKIKFIYENDDVLQSIYPFTYIMGGGDLNDFIYIGDVVFDYEDKIYTIFLSNGKQN